MLWLGVLESTESKTTERGPIKEHDRVFDQRDLARVIKLVDGNQAVAERKRYRPKKRPYRRKVLPVGGQKIGTAAPQQTSDDGGIDRHRQKHFAQMIQQEDAQQGRPHRKEQQHGQVKAPFALGEGQNEQKVPDEEGAHADQKTRFAELERQVADGTKHQCKGHALAITVSGHTKIDGGGEQQRGQGLAAQNQFPRGQNQAKEKEAEGHGQRQQDFGEQRIVLQ